MYLAFKRKFFLKIKLVEASTALAAGNCPQIVTNGDGKKIENLHYEVLICTILCIDAIDFCNCMRYNAPVCATEFLYVRCCACINANSAKITDFIDIAVRLNLFNLFFLSILLSLSFFVTLSSKRYKYLRKSLGGLVSC